MPMPMPMMLRPMPTAAVVLLMIFCGAVAAGGPPAPGCWARAEDAVPKTSSRATGRTRTLRRLMSSSLRECGGSFRVSALVRRVLGQPDEDRGQEGKDERLKPGDEQLQQAQGGHHQHAEDRHRPV